MTDIELWAGPECSVVRVGDAYVDEVEATGHAKRPEDIERLAALGVRAVRYPVLWERTAPDGVPDWSFADERLSRLRALGVRPIVGLVHHGSGPRGTSLLEESFVTGLARFARAVAERYPWVTDFSPVNEPLTTARFSALYGHWYPHLRDDRAFLRALLVQCRAIRAAMAAIREVTPNARLVQTEDLGTVFSTRRLAYQARFENHRRFASLDILTGRFGPRHVLRDFFLGNGIGEDELASFVEEPCPPDVIAMNHYVTSDRFLDEDLGKYPPHTHGGNGREAYADVEAVRVRGAGIPGFRALLELLWERYRLPVAIGEVHMGCTPEEQIRWLAEAWTAAEDARASGADVRAVTLWSAFGACDWDSLLTRPGRTYEPGAFDVRGEAVRPTALARVARDLATRGASDHPLVDQPGWWRRAVRLSYPTFGRVVCAAPSASARPLLVTGGDGTLGRAIAKRCEARGIRAIVLARTRLDITDPASVRAALASFSPWAVVNAAGYVRVDDAEHDRARCLRTNADGAALLAEACRERGIRFATISTDLVFDGNKRAPYVERDEPSPLNVYGTSKALAEKLVLAAHPDALVARTAAFFGPWDEANFVHLALAALGAGRTFRATNEIIVSPTYVPDLADALLTTIVDGASGILHLATPGAVSWYELAERAARLAGLGTGTLIPCSAEEACAVAARPRMSALASEHVALLRPLDDALAAFVAERRDTWLAKTA